MNGAGNDFIILNNMVEGLPAESFPALARRLCDRRMSIGADGLMIEVHNDPEHAKCDGPQCLRPETFDEVAADALKLHAFCQKELHQ